jgi:hypothetical protein
MKWCIWDFLQIIQRGWIQEKQFPWIVNSRVGWRYLGIHYAVVFCCLFKISIIAEPCMTSFISVYIGVSTVRLSNLSFGLVASGEYKLLFMLLPRNWLALFQKMLWIIRLSLSLCFGCQNFRTKCMANHNNDAKKEKEFWRSDVWEYRSSVEYLPSKHEALESISSNTHTCTHTEKRERK